MALKASDFHIMEPHDDDCTKQVWDTTGGIVIAVCITEPGVVKRVHPNDPHAMRCLEVDCIEFRCGGTLLIKMSAILEGAPHHEGE